METPSSSVSSQDQNTESIPGKEATTGTGSFLNVNPNLFVIQTNQPVYFLLKSSLHQVRVMVMVTHV